MLKKSKTKDAKVKGGGRGWGITQKARSRAMCA